MRRKDREVTDINEIQAIMQRGLVCRIGMAEDNIPYVVPVNYAFCGSYIYIHSASEGKKLDILKKNDQVCFEVDTMSELKKSETSCNWGVKYESVIGFGKAVFVEDYDEKIKALDSIMRHYDNDDSGQGRTYEYSEAVVRKIAIIKIEIESMTGKRCQ